jgi:hypothetical protein
VANWVRKSLDVLLGWSLSGNGNKTGQRISVNTEVVIQIAVFGGIVLTGDSAFTDPTFMNNPRCLGLVGGYLSGGLSPFLPIFEILTRTLSNRNHFSTPFVPVEKGAPIINFDMKKPIWCITSLLCNT